MARGAGRAPPREVVVSFGKTTLLLTDLDERPLGHWALGGVSVLGQDPDGATIYAHERGRDADDPRPRHGGGHRGGAAAPAGAAPAAPARSPVAPILAVAAIAGRRRPGRRALIRAATVRLIPPEQAAELGDRMLIALIERTARPATTRRASARSARSRGGRSTRTPRRGCASWTWARRRPSPRCRAAPCSSTARRAATATPEEHRRLGSGGDRDAIRSAALVARRRHPGRASATSSAATSTSGAGARRRIGASRRRTAAPPAEVPTSTESDWEALRGICR